MMVPGVPGQQRLHRGYSGAASTEGTGQILGSQPGMGHPWVGTGEWLCPEGSVCAMEMGMVEQKPHPRSGIVSFPSPGEAGAPAGSARGAPKTLGGRSGGQGRLLHAAR